MECKYFRMKARTYLFQYQYIQSQKLRQTTMSIEQCFTERKNWLVSVFNNLNHLINQLSITVQHEVDQQYLAAKQTLASATPTQLLSYCTSMKAQQNNLKSKLLEILGSYLLGDIGPNPEDTGSNITQKYTSNKDNTHHHKPIHSDHQPPQYHSEAQAAGTASVEIKDRVTRGLKTVSKNSNQITMKTDKRRTYASLDAQGATVSPRYEKLGEPIGLLNKRRTGVSNDSERDYTSQEKSKINRESNPNIQKFITPFPHSDSQSKIKSDRNLTNYANFRSNHAAGQKQTIPQPNNFLIESRVRTVTETANSNPQICEKLDLKIQEEAMAMLNKVKTKRSPNRKNSHKKTGEKTNNTHSILDLSSQTHLPLSRQNYIQRIRQQK